MTLWTCELCDWQGREQQKRGHKAWRCPEQGNLRKNLEKAPKPTGRELPCMCGCGADIPQVKGQRPKHFLAREHYERWRAPTRTAQAVREAEEVEEEAPKDTSRLAREVAPIVAREEEVRLAAEQVPLLSREASFLLWARCLEFNTGDAASVAA